MALNWYWKDKCGELTFSQNYKGEEYKEFTVDLYQGNAYLIAINTYKDPRTGNDMYNLWTFWADKEHMKRCLGTAKGKEYSNLYNDDGCRFIKIRLNKAKNHYWKQIITELATAFDDLTIELYSEKENDNEA